MVDINDFVAATIHYEQRYDASSFGGDNRVSRQVYRDALSIATGRVTSSPAWGRLLRLGINPLDTTGGDGLLQNPYAMEHKDHHPHHIAAAFLDHDKKETDRFLRRYEEDVQLHTRNALASRYRGHVSTPYIDRIFEIPAPPPEIRRCEASSAILYCGSTLRWHTPSELRRLVTNLLANHQRVGALLYDLKEGLCIDAPDQVEAIQQPVRQALERLRDRPDDKSYAAGAQAMWFAPHDVALPFLKQYRGRAYSVLGLALEDAPESVMVDAIRAWCQFQAGDVLSYLRRPPTMKELGSVRRKELLDFIFRMPWKHLEPLAAENAGELRAILLQDFDSVSPLILERFLRDHEGRKLPYTPSGIVASRAGQWDAFKTRLMTQYYTARELRCVLTALPEDHATVLMLAHLTQEPHLKPILEYYDCEGLRDALAAYPGPAPELAAQ